MTLAIAFTGAVQQASGGGHVLANFDMSGHTPTIGRLVVLIGNGDWDSGAVQNGWNAGQLTIANAGVSYAWKIWGGGDSLNEVVTALDGSPPTNINFNSYEITGAPPLAANCLDQTVNTGGRPGPTVYHLSALTPTAPNELIIAVISAGSITGPVSWDTSYIADAVNGAIATAHYLPASTIPYAPTATATAGSGIGHCGQISIFPGLGPPPNSLTDTEEFYYPLTAYTGG